MKDAASDYDILLQRTFFVIKNWWKWGLMEKNTNRAFFMDYMVNVGLHVEHRFLLIFI